MSFEHRPEELKERAGDVWKKCSRQRQRLWDPLSLECSRSTEGVGEPGAE